jgi:hypothetical protein
VHAARRAPKNSLIIPPSAKCTLHIAAPSLSPSTTARPRRRRSHRRCRYRSRCRCYRRCRTTAAAAAAESRPLSPPSARLYGWADDAAFHAVPTSVETSVGGKRGSPDGRGGPEEQISAEHAKAIDLQLPKPASSKKSISVSRHTPSRSRPRWRQSKACQCRWRQNGAGGSAAVGGARRP